MVDQVIVLVDRHIQQGAFLVAVVMIVLTTTSFLCVRHLVKILNQMTQSLQSLRESGGNSQECLTVTSVPIVSKDEIGQVASTVNGLISDIRDISRFRRTIEADETTLEVYQHLAYIFRHRLSLSTFVIWETDDQGEQIRPVYTWPPELESEICHPNTAKACRAKRTGEIVSSNGYPGICPIFPLDDIMTHTCVPMMVGGRILGVVQFLFLFVDSAQREENLTYSLLRAKQYLRETLPVLHAKQLAENLQELATRDPLTGLYNRRFLENNINPLLAGIRRRQSHLAILMCDMDYFKKVNDQYGHEIGDLVLRGLAHILQNCVRSSDLVIRYGGEEFLVLLTDCSTDQALQVAEKIRQTVEKQQFRFEGVSLNKTVSIGISCYPDDTSAFWECLKFADVALYRAKEEGRNKVLRFDPLMWDSTDY